MAKAAKATTPTAEKASQPRATSYASDWIIRVLAKANPKREGSTAHLKYSLYKDGMTVAAFREAASKHPNLKGRVGLKWDIDHGYIKVESPKA